MKTLPRIIIIISFFFFALNFFDFYFTVAGRVTVPPKSPEIEFYADNNELWHRYYLSNIKCIPISSGSLADGKKEDIKKFFHRRFERDQEKSAASSFIKFTKSITAYYLSPILFTKKTRISIYPFQRFREYRNIFFLRILYSQDDLFESLANHKETAANIFGIGILSRELYNRDVNEITNRELQGILELAYCPGRNCYELLNERDVSSMKEKLNKLARNGYNRLNAGGNFRDYCIKTLNNDGLLPGDESIKVFTTLDLEMQRTVENFAVDYIEGLKDQDETRKKILLGLDPIETAVIVVDVKTGAIRAMAGSIRYSGNNVLNRAVISRRQISSTFKPFLYAMAMEDKGLNPESEFEDMPVTMKNRDGTPWEPKNFYPYYLGKVTLREGLVISINTIAVQLIELVGAEKTAARAREVFYLPGNDIEQRIIPEPSLSLGSIDLSPLEVAKGYLVLANDGEEIIPYSIKRVMNINRNNEPFIKRNNVRKKRIFLKDTAKKINNILREVIIRGTASTFIKEPFKFNVSGKSGSSPSDSWFVGYSNDLLVITWAGYDVPKSSLRGRLPEFIVIPFWYRLMESLGARAAHVFE